MYIFKQHPLPVTVRSMIAWGTALLISACGGSAPKKAPDMAQETARADAQLAVIPVDL